MKTVIISTITAIVVSYTVGYATIINIPADYPTIQQGIDASNDGDTVLVQPGVYVENINFNGHNIVLGSLYLVTGDTSYISGTVIDAGNMGSVVTFEDNEDSTATITGFTIQHGQSPFGGGILCVITTPGIYYNIITSNIADATGGGIYCTGSSPRIEDNIIRANQADQGGGIGFNYNSSPLIRNNTISQNESHISGGGGISCFSSHGAVIDGNSITENSCGSSYFNARGGGISCQESNIIISGNFISENETYTFGGGIYCENSQPIIIGNTITWNIAFNGRGGGIYCRTANPTVANNTISNNGAAIKGGGIYCWRSNPTIENNLIFENYTGTNGGGIYCWVSSPDISNCVVYGNIAQDIGGGICLYDTSNAIITNTIIWENSAPNENEVFVDSFSDPVFSYCNVNEGVEGQGNIDIDPLFRDPTNGDFHLMSIECGDPYDSPCIDTGSPAIIDSLLDCSWGLGTILSDMGAYGGGDSATVGIDNFVDLLPERLALLQNYPNPFNASTNISFTLPEPSDIAIEIYNILGQRVDLLFEGNKQAGAPSIVWNASNVASGTYLYKINAGHFSETKRLTLLK